MLGVAALALCAVVLWGSLKFGGTLLYVLLSVLFGYALLMFFLAPLQRLASVLAGQDPLLQVAHIL